MIKLKKLWLLFFLFFLFSFSYAQNINWMLGTWKGTGNSRKSLFIRALNISSVSEYNFIGTRSIEVTDRNHTKIVTEILGRINKDTFYIKDGAIILKKEPPHTTWVNCAQCTHFNKVLLNGDSILLTIQVFNCAPSCDGIFSYFKLLPDFDTVTQRTLVNMFGTPEQILAFKPSVKIIPPVASSDPDNLKPKQNEDSIKKEIALQKKQQQQIENSTKNAIATQKKQQQHFQDSIAIVQKNQQQHTQDSLNNVAVIAKRRQQEIDDSTKNAVATQKKQQQHFQDSIAIVQKNQQQHTQDSLNNVAVIAKRRQEEIDDSTKNAIATQKKQQQHFQDSIAIVQKNQQQHTQDSLNNVAVIAKRRQKQVDDSTKNAVANQMKRQQQIQDSITIIRRNQHQHIEDSLSNAARIAKRRQKQVDDSTKNAVADQKKRQQHIEDSVVAVKKNQQQHIEDSLNNAAFIAKRRQQQIDDSVKNAATVSIKNPVVKDSAKAVATIDKSKMLQRENVLLQTYHIKSPDILIELFDNAQIDGDRVSVFHNNVLIINNQTLLREPITFKVHADAANPQHEFILVAENLGTIPPNTALMRITADNQVYKLSVKTDLKTNAKIDFYYDGN